MDETQKRFAEAIARNIKERAIEKAIQRRREEIKSNLIEFCCFIDPAVEKWYRAEHLGIIAKELEWAAVTPNARLLINIAPRHWKSSLVSEKFPSWYLGLHPERSVILASYGISLAEKFSRSVRDTIQTNERYQQLFPQLKLRTDAMRVDDWALSTAKRTTFRAVGVGGGITGVGANLILIDDPVMDYEQAHSETQRNNLWEWYRQVLRTRAESGASIILIMTRWHEDDLAGRLLDAAKNHGGEPWKQLTLPAIKDGKPLWGERFSLEDLDAIHSAIGDYAWRAQFMGDPGADEGSEIKRPWFNYFPNLPEGAAWQVCPWDLAITEKQVDKTNPDYTASVKACVYNGDLWLGQPRLMRSNWTVIKSEMMADMINHPTIRFGTGKSMVETATVQSLIREGYKLEQYDERKHGDKRARASVWINWARTGRVKLVGSREEWDSFMAQWCAFPLGHDDAIDVVSGASLMLNLTFDNQPRRQSESYDREWVNTMDWLGSMR